MRFRLQVRLQRPEIRPLKSALATLPEPPGNHYETTILQTVKNALGKPTFVETFPFDWSRKKSTAHIPVGLLYINLDTHTKNHTRRGWDVCEDAGFDLGKTTQP